jgi:hypothetical protein
MKGIAMPKNLKSVTGERPRCQYCDKELVPDSSSVELIGHLSEAPAAAGYLAEYGYHPDRVFRLKHRQNYSGDPITSISFWRGTYLAYGKGKDGTPLFCSQPCGWQFGVACWNAGMRIPKRK